MMANLGKPEEGNTKPPPRVIPSKFWCFTLNNWTEENLAKILECFKNAKYIIGKEIGKENGIRHLQGYVEFDKIKRPIEFVGIKEIHWEKRKGSREDNLKYCSKDGDFITNFEVKKPLKKLACEDNFYPWQTEILNIVKGEPDDRTIYWYWEEKGCTGKTTFSKYLTRKHGAVPLEGKKNDILYCAAMFESEIYIYDLERSLEEFVSYAAIEKIKNGYYMCAKYESKPIDRNCPHLIVFANFPPQEHMLSKDRWVIKKIE